MAMKMVTPWHKIQNPKLVAQYLRKILMGWKGCDEYKTLLLDLEQTKEIKESWYGLMNEG